MCTHVPVCQIHQVLRLCRKMLHARHEHTVTLVRYIMLGCVLEYQTCTHVTKNSAELMTSGRSTALYRGNRMAGQQHSGVSSCVVEITARSVAPNPLIVQRKPFRELLTGDPPFTLNLAV